MRRVSLWAAGIAMVFLGGPHLLLIQEKFPRAAGWGPLYYYNIIYLFAKYHSKNVSYRFFLVLFCRNGLDSLFRLFRAKSRPIILIFCEQKFVQNALYKYDDFTFKIPPKQWLDGIKTSRLFGNLMSLENSCILMQSQNLNDI